MDAVYYKKQKQKIIAQPISEDIKKVELYFLWTEYINVPISDTFNPKTARLNNINL